MKRKEKQDRNFTKQFSIFCKHSTVRLHGIELSTCGWVQSHGCAESCSNYAEEEEEEENDQIINSSRKLNVNVNINTESHTRIPSILDWKLIDQFKVNAVKHASKHIEHNTNQWEILLAFKSNETFPRAVLNLTPSFILLLLPLFLQTVFVVIQISLWIFAEKLK